MVALQRVTHAAAMVIGVIASSLVHARTRVRADISTFSGVVQLAGLRPR